MEMKQLLLCFAIGIPFGLWPYIMNKSGIQNAMIFAGLLFGGSIIPFLMTRNSEPPLQPGVTIIWALGIALSAAFLHGIGHRLYQSIIVNHGKNGINLGTMNIAIFMVMLATIVAANTLILNQPLTAKKGLAVLTAILTIILMA